nr:MAG TPA: hypothetical protein [Caudoviricetes sp.]
MEQLIINLVCVIFLTNVYYTLLNKKSPLGTGFGN